MASPEQYYRNPQVRPQGRIEENFDIDSFRLEDEDLVRISQMDRGVSQILDIRSLLEVYRLFHIRFEQ